MLTADVVMLVFGVGFGEEQFTVVPLTDIVPLMDNVQFILVPLTAIVPLMHDAQFILASSTTIVSLMLDATAV